MSLGYQARRESPPVYVEGTLLKSNERSFFAKLKGVVTPIWLPQSQVGFVRDENGAHDANDKPQGRFVIPGWLARKEGIPA